MKKTYRSLLFALIATAGFTACSDYEAPDITTESAISIVSRETTFPAAASAGTITFNAKGPVTVQSSSEWLSASVEGNTINLNVAQNNSLDGRAATLYVKCGNITDEIAVIQSGLIFKFNADVATIDIDSDAWTTSYDASANVDIEVSSDAEWLTADLADGKLTIAATRNTGLSARTGLLTISAGSLKSEITVNQGPLSFPLVKITEISQNDDEKVYTYDFPSDIAVDLTADVNWINASFANETVTIKVDANNSGHMRSGTLTYSVDGTTGEVEISQYDFDKDIVGEYQWIYTDPKDNNDYFILATINHSDKDYSLDFSVGAYKLSAAITWDDATRTLSLAGGTYLGKWSSYYAFICYSYNNASDGKTYTTWGNAYYMDASFTYFEQEGNGYTGAEFVDGAGIANPINYLMIYAFKEQTAASGGTVGYITRMIEPVLLRTHDISAESVAKTSATPFKRTAASKNARRIANARQVTEAQLSNDNVLAH